MAVETSGGRLWAVPLHLNPAVPDKHTPLFDHLVAHPYWFSVSLDPDEVRREAAGGLCLPDTRAWEVWEETTMVGLLVLTKLLPGLDATVHFTFWRTNLFAARRLIHAWLGVVFQDYDLQRVTVEVPEHTKGILAFVRQRLGFRFEGEADCASHKIGVFLESDAAKKHGILTHEAGMWLAKQGSRRECAHWDPKAQKFRDVLILRLLRREYAPLMLPADARATSATDEVTPTDESRSETG